jgi:hypothetical protein
MKSITLALSSCAVAGGLLLAGCSKHQDTKPSAENNPTADNAAGVASADSVEMKIRWPVGTRFSWRMELVQNVTTKVPNAPQPVKQLINMSQEFDMTALKELADGGRELELVFKGLSLSVNQGDTPVMNFDSTQPAAQDANNPITPLLRKMIGGHVRYLLNATGGVEKVEGIDELLARIGFNPKSQQQAMFKQMFDEDSLRQYASVGEMMPNRTVKLGEGWDVKKEIPSEIGKLTVNMKYTFKNWEQQNNRKCARIETRGTMSTASGAPTGNANMKLDDGKTTGTIWFDPELGMTVDSDIQQKMTIKVLAGGQTVTPEVEQKIHATLVDAQTVH